MGGFSREDMKEILWQAIEKLDLVQLSIHSLNRYEYVNPSFLRRLGLSEEEVCSPSFRMTDWRHPEDLEKFTEVTQPQTAGEGVPTDLGTSRIVPRDGTIMHLLTSGLLLDFHGQSALVRASVDITERVEAYEKLHRALEGTIHAMARVVETRDPYTAGHQERVATLACAIAEKMEVPDEIAEGIKMAGVIHDLGKLRVPADILTNPGRLSDHEYGIIKTHPQVAYDILKDIDFTWPLADIVLQHHERFDGSGYPQGLAGEDILIEARILGVADVVEAMASHRPYRPALGIDAALEEISAGKGTRYAPAPAEACLGLFQDGTFSFEA